MTDSTTTEQGERAYSTLVHASTTVSLQHVEGSEWRVRLTDPDARHDMQDYEAGRVILGSFQPAPFVPAAFSPEVLHAIAQLIEEATTGRETMGLQLAMMRTEDSTPVQIGVDLTYPAGNGIAAAVAVTAAPDALFAKIARELLARGDASAREVAEKARTEARAEALAEVAEDIAEKEA